jgi:hypothetical protein
VANPNEPRPDGSQPPQPGPLGSPFPHGPSGPHDASQGPPVGQGPPPGPVPQGPWPPYPPQGQYPQGPPPQGQYPHGPPPGPGHPPQAPPPGYPYQGPPPGFPHPGQPPQGPPPGHPPYGHPGAPGPGGRSAAPWLIVGGVALALLLVGGAVLGGFLFYGGTAVSDEASGSGGAGGGGTEGVETFEDLSKDHVETGVSVDYEQYPPVGGEHYGFWQNCGVYDEPVLTEAAVHSLEHGAVWITHDPALSDDEVATLTAHHTQGSYVLVSPMEDLPSPVVASAWGAQLKLDDPADPRLADFLLEYEQSPHAPEPGAPCSGAFDGTQAEFDAEGAGEVGARMN